MPTDRSEVFSSVVFVFPAVPVTPNEADLALKHVVKHYRSSVFVIKEACMSLRMSDVL